MKKNVTKEHRARLLRHRVADAMARAGVTQSALARRVGVDRSTLSQLLTDDGARVPNAHVLGTMASALAVSSDWLLGLSDRPENAQALLAGALEITDAPRALIDEQIYAWHREAAGHKIRHVPATLPDMMKTPAMLEWEYTPHLGRTAEQAINASMDRLSFFQTSRSDYELAVATHEIESFARGTGYYCGIPEDVRRAQLDHLCDLTDRLYPRFRLYIYDARKVFSAPVTVFGGLLAVVYIGQSYVVFRDTDRITALTTHFDTLVRECDTGARDCIGYLCDLRARLGGGTSEGVF